MTTLDHLAIAQLGLSVRASAVLVRADMVARMHSVNTTSSMVWAMSRSQLKVKPVAEFIMRPFAFGREQVEAHG